MNKCTDCSYHMFKTHESNNACGQFKSIKKSELKYSNRISLGVPLGELNIIMSGKGRSRL